MSSSAESRQTHRAIVREGTVSRVVDRLSVRPTAGEIVIAPERVSLCGTDIQIVRGDRDDPSPIVGHEGAARVLEIGDEVTGLTPGQRVVVNPTHPGDPSFLLGHNVDGLFQERVLIGESAVTAGLLVPITDDLSPSRATLIEPWAVTRYALECLMLREPDTLLIIGDGLIGNLAAVMATSTLVVDRTVVLHRTTPGADFTSSAVPGVVNHMLNQRHWIGDVGNSVALLVATHRSGTIDAIERVVRELGRRLVSVHPLGGIGPGSTCPSLPGVDPVGVRAANTGGTWPPATTRFRGRELDITMSGNRGVHTSRLGSAARELALVPSSVDDLLTHDVDLHTGVDIMNTLCHDRTRIIDGQPVIRLVIEMNTSRAKISC